MNKFMQVAAAAVLVGAMGVAQASPVSWHPVSDISGDADVSTHGSLVGAYNFGSNSATTVNGVLFKSMLIGAPQVGSATIDGVHTLAIIPERTEHTLTNFATGSTLSGSLFLALTPEYQALLGSSAGGNFADRVNYLTLGDLVVGQAYEFQAWFNDSGPVDNFIYGLSISDAATSAFLDPIAQQDGNGKLIAGGTGQYVIGTFVADADTQDIEYLRSELAGGINGFQLRAITPSVNVPEPDTLALIVLAAFGLGVVRRRSQRV